LDKTIRVVYSMDGIQLISVSDEKDNVCEKGGAMVQWFARSTSGREVAVVGLNPLAAGCRVATVGQLLVAPWAWAYSTSTLHPLRVSK